MYKKIPDIIWNAAKILRRNMTVSEKLLWNEIRNDKLGVRFLRQKPLYIYTELSWQDRFIIPDFYSHSIKLIIEVDGTIHNTPEVMQLDEVKQSYLDKLEINVIRIKNDEINHDLESVILKIKKEFS